MRYALVNAGAVVNIILLEQGAEWAPPEGHDLVQSDTANLGDSYVAGEFVPPAEPDDEPPSPPSPEELLAYLADKRFRVETGGIVFSGAPIKTDRESQSILTSAYVKAQANPSLQINNWKVANGIFTTLNNATILALGDAVTAHVQASFDTEAALTAGILATPPVITDYSDIENAAWPSNSG